ncbi:glycosyltransferase family 2 protein [Fibrella sp. HMF5335]|uniref:Glycosyltransferase family 2 protein n=1 Tax=Fibrella rubiginis TaxID=2817060 RepID=A0A939GHL3_9BACT|nr:glycosyltransferase family 2 protein [Fibrella rubiginis]MBO0936930.1 glycosyltransferase family 2 protein [Fibrella rubiginis]
MATTSNPRPRLSVALCTYNGAAHLREQWDSLLAQEWLPDELVVSDDASTDNTVALLQELAQTAPFAVVVRQNEQALGSNKNFGIALAACTGDLIFICDQDDVWFPAKMRLMTEYFMQNPAVNVVFADAELADEQLQPLGGTFWEKVRFTASERKDWQRGQAMHVLLNGNRVMGCAMALRATFRRQALPIPDPIPGGYIYDGWLALVAAATQSIRFIEQPLQRYRTHGGQQMGIRPPEAPPTVALRDRFGRDRDVKLAPFRQQETELKTLLDLFSQRVGSRAAGLSPLQHRLAHFHMRASLPTNRLLRLWPVAEALFSGKYQRYADLEANFVAPYVAALGDLLE